MSQLIDLTIYSRNANVLTTPTVYGFDVEDIVVPIVVNSNGKSSFVARMIKGSITQSNNLAKAVYEVNETLTAIANKSPLLVKLTVVKRRGVDIANVEYVFVASRISENIAPTALLGSKFFYNEDGDSLPVEYEVVEDIATIIAATSIVNPPATPLTWAQAQAIRNAGLIDPADGFMPGEFYHITDAAAGFVDEGIIVQAVNETELSLHGNGIFLNADYQSVGDYSGVTGFNTSAGVWRASLEAGLVNGDVVFWNNFHWEIIDDSLFNGNDPTLNAGAYSILSKSDTNGYIRESDIVHYDFNADQIYRRFDKRGNDISGLVAISNFQWGNDSVVYNIVNTGAILQCANNTSDIDYNILYNAVNVVAHLDSSALKRCELSASIGLVVLEVSGKNYFNKILKPGYSNFEAELDFSDNSIWDGPTNTLTIPSSFNFVGIFNIINPDAVNAVEKIVNLPSNHISRFYPENGGTQGFTHTAVGVAVADNLVSDAAATNAIVGRTNGSDFIEYERAGNLNRRYNVVVLA